MTPREEPDSALLERLLAEDHGGHEPPSQLASARDCLRFLEQVWPRPVGTKHEPIKLGRFEIVREIGRGGHGIVLLARDSDHDRDVALKLPRPEVLLSDSLRWRFEQEAQVAARLSHPNIVPIFEVGRTEATWYIASAYCPGPNLAAWLKERGRPAPRDAAAIVKGLAAAVTHAHDKGLLHRDIKPANVLMQVGSGQPAVPMLTDFGLAKLIEPELDADEVTVQQTQSGAILGTIKYMAPEQVQGHRDRIGVATDIYALGAVLYELLCGAPPFDDRTPLAILTRIIAEDPRRPRARRHEIPLDLESICLKCLEKEPSRRFRSAADLEADLAAFLAGEPVRARPISVPRRLARWAQRRPALSVAIVAAFMTLVTGLVGAGIHYLRLKKLNNDLAAALGRAERQADELRWHAYVNDVRLAAEADPAQTHNVLRDLLQRHIPAAGESDLRGFEWHYLWDRIGQPRELRNVPGDVLALAVTADGRSVLAACRDGRSARWDVPGEDRADTGRFLPPGTSGFVYSPDGSRIVALESGGRLGAVGIWDTQTGKVIAERTDLPPRLGAVAFDPAARRLVYADCAGAGHPTRLRLWDITNGEDVLLWDRPVGVQALRFSPDGRFIVWADDTPLPREAGAVALHTYDVSERREQRSLPLGNTIHQTLAVSRDGQRVVTGDIGGRVRVHDAATGELLAACRFVDEAVVQLDFVASDARLVAVTHDRKDASKARILLLDLNQAKIPD